METLKDIKRRMRSIKDIHKVTKAMKMVSIAKLRKAEKDSRDSEVIHEKLEEIFVGKKLNLHKADTPALIKGNEADKTVYMLICSDKGLCGSFNKNVFKLFESIYRNEKGSIYAIGKKAVTFIKRQNLSADGKYFFPGRNNAYKFTQNVVFDMLNKFSVKEIGKVKVIFNKNISAITQKAQIEQLIPFVVNDEKLDKGEKSKHMCEPSELGFMKQITEELIKTKLFNILNNSATAEHTARMNAMDAASDNAAELLDELRVSYNKARQAAITTEIVEIASTAEALKS